MHLVRSWWACLALGLLAADMPAAEARDGICMSKGGTPMLTVNKRDCEAAGAEFVEFSERREPASTLRVCYSKAGTAFERLTEAECKTQGWEMREVAREEAPNAGVARMPRGGASRLCPDGQWKADCDSGGQISERAAEAIANFEAVVEAQAVLRARCSAKWPGNFQMQEYCIEQQQDGARKVSAWTKDPSVADSAELRAVVVACSEKWTDAHGRNWPMIDYCIEQQVSAYRRLR